MAKTRGSLGCGQTEHERRSQILEAAYEQFRYYGYHKTTISDIARAIHLSTAYLYNFFDSKQAIGEAVCTQVLTGITSVLAEQVRCLHMPEDRIRLIYSSMASESVRLYVEDRRIHDIIPLAFQGKWGSPTAYNSALLSVVREVVSHGRDVGEFERKTPLKRRARQSATRPNPQFSWSRTLVF